MQIRSLLPWLMWILATVFFCYGFSLQVSIGVIANDLMHDFSVNATALGSLAALYFYAYIAMQIPGGILIDYFGARYLLAGSVFICACGTILFATAHIFIVAILGRLLIGLGSSTAYVGCTYIAATRLPINRFSLLNGLVVTVGMLGAIGGQAPLAFLVAKLHWRLAMVLLAAFGLVIALLMWLVIRDKK
jgi:predicted MFS family arabinose efflux permease